MLQREQNLRQGEHDKLRKTNGVNVEDEGQAKEEISGDPRVSSFGTILLENNVNVMCP